ncbi:hypothetical protein VTL71DRAFT_3406 [Oculimacula yallundae]|uniref:WSC domain-containing protein n=1 Tax=Oculimacula yallundae TaxID=86028 RepID=A0ABR4C879_9HELO
MVTLHYVWLMSLHALVTLASARSNIEKRAVVVSTSLPVNWTYTGCYVDQQNSHTLSGAMYYNDTAMTETSCILFCNKRGFTQAGVEYSSECFCGNDDLSQETIAPSTDCNMGCSGNSSLSCGAGNRLTTFSSNQTATSPITNKGIGLWALYGCYTEGINGRALTTNLDVPGGDNNLTVASCINACQSAGFVLSGVEYGGECFCGNQFSYQSKPASNGYKGCNMACNGNATELCGGSNYLDVYGFNNTVPNPLVSTSSSVRSTSTSSSVSTRSASATTSSLVSPSSSSSSQLSTPQSLTQNSQTTASSSTTSQTSSSQIQSSQASSTSTSQSVPTSTTSPAVLAVTPASASSSSLASSISTLAPSSPSWYADGCWTDAVGGRALMNQQYGDASIMTVELCMKKCANAGYTVAGLEYYSECYCDSQIRNGNIRATDPTTCNTACTGNSTQNCGGGNRLALFRYGLRATSSSSTSSTQSSTSLSSSSVSQTTPSVPTSSSTQSTAPSWKYLGCYVDYVGSRTLNNQIYGNGDTMTPELYCDTALRNGGGPAPDGSTGCNMACHGNNTAMCGGPNRLNLYSFTTPSTSTSASSQQSSSSSQTVSSTTSSKSALASSAWTSLGCYNDSVASRTLSNAIYGNNDIMTVELCEKSCKTAGFTLAGVEYGGECFCDNSIQNYGAPASDGCTMACHGNAQQMCGGGNRMNVYQFITFVASSSSSQGSSSSTLSSLSSSSSSVSSLSSIPATSQSSSSSSSSSSLPISGTSTTSVVSAQTGTSTGPTSSTSSTSIQSASMTSTSSSSGTSVSSAISLSSSSTILSSSSSTSSSVSSSLSSSSTSESSTTSLTSSSTSSSVSASVSPTKAVGWYSAGCYVDGVGSRTLRYGMQVPGGGGSMTVEACNSVCQTSKYTIAGVEYGGECFCDNSYQNGGGPAPDGNTGCNMACNGNATEMCGGPNRLNVYTYYSGPPSTMTSSTTNAASTSTQAAAVPTGLPANWTYSGCYIDNANGRIMLNQQQDNQRQTIASCVNKCSNLGYIVAGMEYGAQCFCDNYIRNGAALAASDKQCGMSCPGDTTTYCGAGDRVSIYNKGNLTVFQPPKSQNTSLPGNWTLKGCLTDDADKRTFPYRITNMMDNNTATACLSLCSRFGYPAGGMEFGSECYCGDFSDIVNAGATMRPDSECNMACSGDPNTICGAGERISYYAWNGDPLYTWDRPTGVAAGEYQFLIGGVVIPIITSQTITGKVTFLEKFGTGAPNTTGAYELDLARLDDFAAAWRPMHVKSDIFCSGGLTLPDKAGRQINVGGWANDDTFGIRLYWPDGSPGVAGKNDWQENVKEVKLQNGRWYPTPMIMSNGSILVVGGQQGSNGAPVPTLEILPRAGGVLYCDWLARTDPYNLYPFLAVLPSGGVFVAYYNEARILDPGSLQTSRTLPNIPGAVNDFDGGRTYPFEGTAVLLPQHAPYSDPLEILICGGSTPGPEIALDNCVTLAPDQPNANWTIERMPSARVISCMAALPDGTFLIMNGGQQGRAGFGLTVNPNHNAVLYDPSKPLHSRMSVMANTTIDRLYHSEAIVLQDGRVLVTGSDPEDERFAQEYRVEVFVPPYLLSGKPRPTFTIVNKDWAYGQTVTVQITSGTSGNIRASLLGAESSTHGNSMGQRTLFPAISCSGNTCSITAPPNANICPPGWFMLFLLDGATPSIATYVRIGGDPAGLGNWPNHKDFTVPGV